MICITVLGASPERRFAIIERLNALQRSSIAQLTFLPELSIKPISPEEIKFISPPDICIIDEQFASHDLMEIAKIKRALPHSALIIELGEKLNNLLIIEQLARLGISDTISSSISAEEFFRKIILLTKNREKQKHGCLVVIDSGKGGAGVTSVAAALGECCASNGKRTALIDCDTETQDLSRYLQMKPYVNENLESVLSLHRPIIRETVEQCFISHSEIEHLFCAPPPISEFYPKDLSTTEIRSYLSFLESADSLFDITIIDTASLGRVVRQALYRVADRVLFVLNSDPASMFGVIERIQQAHASCKQEDVFLLENNIHRHGLPSKLFRYELSRAIHSLDTQWSKYPLSFCRNALRWPGSYSSMYGVGGRSVQRSIKEIATAMQLCGNPETSGWIKNIFKLRKIQGSILVSSEESAKLLVEEKEQKAQLPFLRNDAELISHATQTNCSQVPVEEEEFISNASLH